MLAEHSKREGQRRDELSTTTECTERGETRTERTARYRRGNNRYNIMK